MILIAAMTRARVIGKGDGLPWSIPEEYAQFLRTIDGQIIIAGRRSYQIFGPDLTSRHNIVISRQQLDWPNVLACNSMEQAYTRAKSLGRKIFCIGGAAIYALALPHADKLYLSFIKKDYDGDTYFPAFDRSAWRTESRRDYPDFEFVIYGRHAT
jgi:dihydrofolate reductase